ncbi:MAG TPA: amino acid permease [Solirubrobacteraceae bacterium]|nr:amino acid permease [Solirubrobacteraceae bacterium]
MREISIASAVALNLSFISIVYGVIGATQVPLAFPGASIALSAVICTLFCVPPYIMYSFFSKAMPRSGGDYVFASRALHPWAGLATSVNGTLWYTFAITYASFSTIQFALSATLASVGTISGNHGLVTASADVLKHGWTFGLGLVVTALILATVCVRLPLTLKITRWLFYVVAAGTGVAAIVLLVSSRSDFVSAVAHAGGNYHKIVADSLKAGYKPAGFSLGQSILSSSVPFYALGFGIATAYVGGEIRGGKDVATRGKLYSLLLGGIAITIIFALSSHVIGKTFLGGATLLSNSVSPQYPFSAPSNLFFYIDLLSGSTVVAVILGITFMASAIAVAIPAFLISSRALFAWSFDRFIPERVSEVNARTRAPLRANLIAAAVAVVMLAVVTFGPTSLVAGVAGTEILGLCLTFIVVSVAAITFPYRRASIYKGSAIERSVGGVPLMTLVGAASLVVYILFAYSIASTKALGATTTTGIIALVLFVALGAVAYPVVYLLNKRRGVDISLASRELPPE